MNIIKKLLLIILFTTTSYATKETVTLQLPWQHQFQFAGYYMAIEKGFYDEINLNVNLLEIVNNSNTIDDILSNKINYAIGRISLINQRSHGKKNSIISLDFTIITSSACSQKNLQIL